MADAAPDGSALCAVRIARSGPVLFVAAGGADARPGDRVVIELEGSEAVATVIVSAAQLVSCEAQVSPGGRIVRLATADDALEPSAPEGSAAALRSWTEWLAKPGDEPSLELALDDAAPSARALIDGLFPEDGPGH